MTTEEQREKRLLRLLQWGNGVKPLDSLPEGRTLRRLEKLGIVQQYPSLAGYWRLTPEGAEMIRCGIGMTDEQAEEFRP